MLSKFGTVLLFTPLGPLVLWWMRKNGERECFGGRLWVRVVGALWIDVGSSNPRGVASRTTGSPYRDGARTAAAVEPVTVDARVVDALSRHVAPLPPFPREPSPPDFAQMLATVARVFYAIAASAAVVRVVFAILRCFR